MCFEQRRSDEATKRSSGGEERRSGACSSAFTLVEILVVLVIIGLLAGVTTMSVRGALVRAKQNTARMEIANICQALDVFYAIYDRYPTNEEGLGVLTKPGEKNADPLVVQRLIDPWGRPYQYNQPGKSGPYEVISLGADGREGGEGADADIVSSNLKDTAGATGTPGATPIPGSGHGTP